MVLGQKGPIVWAHVMGCACVRKGLMHRLYCVDTPPIQRSVSSRGVFVIGIRLQVEVLKDFVMSITVAHSLSLPMVTSTALVKAL